MEDELLSLLYRILDELSGFKRAPRQQFSGGVVALVYFWAVLNDRPMNWACDKRHWRRPDLLPRLPSPSTLCNRRRDPSVQKLIDALERRVLQLQSATQLGCFILDAKPLTVSSYSKDPHARLGYAYDGIARGYKLFALTDHRGNFISYRVGAMNCAEPVIARRLIGRIEQPGYILGDGIYDSVPLHAAVASHRHTLQLIAPRKKPQRPIGPRARHPARLRAIDLLENGTGFGPRLFDQRTAIERAFARLTNCPVGLKGLPNWVRTHPRVHRWVQAKIVLVSLYTKNLAQ
jgi:hypothetical protein